MDRLMSAIEEIHLIELEQGWNDEMKCQALHQDPKNWFCSEEVTHRAFSCSRPNGMLVCQAHATYYVRCMEDGIICSTCGSPATADWKVLPA